MTTLSVPTCESGIPALGAIPWGSHFCNFYQTRSDLADCVVPFFRAGLANNEACFWVTSDPLNARDAKRLLGNVQSDLADREACGQMMIVDFADWYLDSQRSVTARALQDGLDRVVAAQQRGFAGVRMSGNSFWLERKYWSLFNDYEQQIQESVRNSKIVVLCSYSLERCSGRDVLEVLGHHDFAISRDSEGWQVVRRQGQKRLFSASENSPKKPAPE